MAKSPVNRLKELLQTFSQDYFSDDNGSELSFVNDMTQLPPRDRVATMVRLLKFTLPEMKSTDISVDIGKTVTPISQRMARLLEEGDPRKPSQLSLEI